MILQETAFADRLIQHFEAGLLPLENGATLRAFLSKKLNCDPMRISKKFAGARCLGKQIFLKRAPDAPLDEHQVHTSAGLRASHIPATSGQGVGDGELDRLEPSLAAPSGLCRVRGRSRFPTLASIVDSLARGFHLAWDREPVGQNHNWPKTRR